MSADGVTGTTIREGDVRGRYIPGLGPGPHPAVLVIHGAGGARGYEQRYGAMLAHHGYAVFCVEYFGAPGIRNALVEVPLEEFQAATKWLLDRPAVTGDTVRAIGFSRGGEAALLIGSQFDRIGGVIAYVPGCYVWPAPSWMDGVSEGEPSWTLDGDPLPFLPVDKYVYEDDEIDAPLGVPEPNASTLALTRSTDQEKARAMIPVEKIDGSVLCVSGGKDTIWPSSTFARRVIDRLEDHDHPHRAEHLHFPDAGHAIRVPYRHEQDATADDPHPYGGTSNANAHAAARAWCAALHLLEPTR